MNDGYSFLGNEEPIWALLLGWGIILAYPFLLAGGGFLFPATMHIFILVYSLAGGVATAFCSFKLRSVLLGLFTLILFLSYPLIALGLGVNY